jgi:hypothetical protein
MKNYLAFLQKYGYTSIVKDDDVPVINTKDDLDREIDLFVKEFNLDIGEGK